jgi:hypothetical protein
MDEQLARIESREINDLDRLQIKLAGLKSMNLYTAAKRLKQQKLTQVNM